MLHQSSADADLCWRLLYTKARCEFWAEANLRKQGYAVVLPRVMSTHGVKPLFPRYVFAGSGPTQSQVSLRGTFGISHVVRFGDRPARVPHDVIVEIRSRMDARGIVVLDPMPQRNPLFSPRERERVRTILKLTQAGFRVRAA